MRRFAKFLLSAGAVGVGAFCAIIVVHPDQPLPTSVSELRKDLWMFAREVGKNLKSFLAPDEYVYSSENLSTEIGDHNAEE